MGTMDPERCNGCGPKEQWVRNPDGFTEGPLGFIPNSDMLDKANRICPGIKVALKKVTGSDLRFSEDGGSVILPTNMFYFSCELFEKAFGDKA